MHEVFGVAFCFKPLPLRDESVAQILEIVDLSVHHYTHRSGLVPDRLVAASHVNDAKPPNGQTHRFVNIATLIIRSTVNQARNHSGQAFVVPKSSKPADSTHCLQASLTHTAQSSRQ